MTSLLSVPLTVVSVDTTATGGDGRPVRSESRTAVHGGVRLRGSTDVQDGGLVTSEDWRVYLPADCAVEPGDLIEFIDGRVFEVVGTAFPAINHRTGAVHHLEVPVRRAGR